MKLTLFDGDTLHSLKFNRHKIIQKLQERLKKIANDTKEGLAFLASQGKLLHNNIQSLQSQVKDEIVRIEKKTPLGEQLQKIQEQAAQIAKQLTEHAQNSKLSQVIHEGVEKLAKDAASLQQMAVDSTGKANENILKIVHNVTNSINKLNLHNKAGHLDFNKVKEMLNKTLDKVNGHFESAVASGLKIDRDELEHHIQNSLTLVKDVNTALQKTADESEKPQDVKALIQEIIKVGTDFVEGVEKTFANKDAPIGDVLTQNNGQIRDALKALIEVAGKFTVEQVEKITPQDIEAIYHAFIEQLGAFKDIEKTLEVAVEPK